MYRFIIFALTQVFVAHLQSAAACTVPPDHMYVSHQAAIKEAEWIVIAKALNAVDGGINMQAIEYLKGSGPKIFLLHNATSYGARGDNGNRTDNNFYGHEASQFWTSGGRSLNESDCEIHPSISFSDNKYLIFGPLDYNVGFENIANQNDLWLTYVREFLAGQSPKKPYPVPLAKYLNDAKAVVRFRAKWEVDRAVWTEEVLKGDRKSYANMLFVSPAAFFESAVNPNCLKYGSKRDIETFDRIYVLEKLPANEIRLLESLECAGADLGSSMSLQSFGVFSRNGATAIEIDADGQLRTLPPIRHSRIWQEERLNLEQFLQILE